MGQKSWDACNKNKPNFETSFNKKNVDKVIDKVDNLWHNLLFFQFNSMRTAIKSRLQLNEAKQPIKNVEKYSRGRQADGGLYAGEGGHPPLMPRCLCGPLSPAWEGKWEGSPLTAEGELGVRVVWQAARVVVWENPPSSSQTS